MTINKILDGIEPYAAILAILSLIIWLGSTFYLFNVGANFDPKHSDMSYIEARNYQHPLAYLINNLALYVVVIALPTWTILLFRNKVVN